MDYLKTYHDQNPRTFINLRINQHNAFQFGVNVDTTTAPFTIHAEVESPYFLVNGNPITTIDFQSMGRIFIGLVKCGAWGCFDEFNRLKEDQLSAISQQIQVIQDAIKKKQPTISLLSREINVDFNAGIFVTLNPAGKGYGGRSKLPDNLKALFRPVAMGRPDNSLIAEVILYSEGFFPFKYTIELGN